MFRKALMIGAFVAIAAPAAFATLHVAQIPNSDYGHLDQNNPEVLLGPTACGPTSVVNSFLMLENHDPSLSALTAADPYQTVNELESYMGTNNTSGTNIGNLITGKRQYIQDVGLGNKVSVEGETFFNLGIEGVADNTKPTYDYIIDQLNKGQDLEILINWWDGTKYTGSGHFLTVTGLTWDDVANTGTLAAVDPWGGVDVNGTLGLHNGFLQLTYGGGAAIDPNNPDDPEHVSTADISGVVAESPIPEPASIGLIIGAFTLAATRRSRREA